MQLYLPLYRHTGSNYFSYFKYFLQKKKLALLFCMSLFLFNKVGATTYPVTSYATLTSALASAVDGDIISITANIVVTAEVPISKTLTFNGNNYTISVPVPGITDAGIVAASPSAFRVFNITASGKTIIFNNLIIKGGGTSATGAAVSVSTGTIAIFISCTISNSKAASGGGLYNAGTCYLSKSHITRNAANFGGGFLNSAGSMFIEYTDISENRSLSASGGGGGCENNTSGNLYINNSTFSNNQSTELGGAINNNGAYAYITNTSFTGNVAYGSYKGGAIAQNASGKTMYLASCLFGYNYYNNNSGTIAYTLDDVHAYAGTINLYYCTYMASSITSGTVTSVVGNNIHLLAIDGSTNDLFTGGSLGQITDANGNLYGTFNVFRPFLVNISGARVPTLKTGSYALAKGCNTGFTNGSGTAVVGYKNMSTSTWVNLVGTGASSYSVTDDETNYTRPATPAAGALDKIVDNYIILKVVATTNGTVNGASIYGDVYPSGTAVSMVAIANAGYALINWTYNLGGTGVVSGNPLTLTLTQNTTLTPNFLISSNYTMTYLSNTSTSGTAPAIASNLLGVNGTIASNTGSLAKTGFTFAGWNTADNGSGTDYAAGATYTANTNVALYAKWTSLGFLLDVHLVNFLATPSNGGKEVQLTWQTSAENNSSYFELQRSKDCNTDWEYITQVTAAGFSSITSYYSYTDKQPFSGSFCYRLKEVDRDGKFVYLPVISVRLNNNLSGAINIFPNPSKNIVYIMGDNINGAAHISLFNHLGQNINRMCKISQQTDRKYSIDISRLPAGIYLIKTNTGTNRFTVQ